MIWLPAQFVTFSLIPKHMRITFVAGWVYNIMITWCLCLTLRRVYVANIYSHIPWFQKNIYLAAYLSFGHFCSRPSSAANNLWKMRYSLCLLPIFGPVVLRLVEQYSQQAWGQENEIQFYWGSLAMHIITRQVKVEFTGKLFWFNTGSTRACVPILWQYQVQLQGHCGWNSPPCDIT